MKTLFLLRHAKAGWDTPSQPDFDRALTDRGHSETGDLAALAQSVGYSPQLIICSTSRRTRQTLAGLLDGLSAETQLMLTRAVYEAPPERLLGLARTLPPEAESAMIIGHNPGMEELARALAGSGDRSALTALAAKYPPAGLAVLTFTCEWAAIGPGTGRLHAFHTPA